MHDNINMAHHATGVCRPSCVNGVCNETTGHLLVTLVSPVMKVRLLSKFTSSQYTCVVSTYPVNVSISACHKNLMIVLCVLQECVSHLV